jgi:hypothetical protein
MRLKAYLRRGRVFIPTLGLVTRGLYRDIEPVTIVDVSETGTLRRSLSEIAARGHPPTGPYPQPNPLPVVAKHAGVKRWADFARGASPWTMRGASPWTIKERNGIYTIMGYRREPNNWAEDPEQTINFPLGTGLDQVIDCLIEILLDAARASPQSGR